jgi:putative hemolysin
MRRARPSARGSLLTRGLTGLASALGRGKRLKQHPVVIEQEIRSLVEAGHKDGTIEDHERKIIDSVFQLGDYSVRDIMVPRPDIVAIEVTRPLKAAVETIVDSGFTRIPAYRGDIDHIEGIVHAKDVLNLLHQGRPDTVLAAQLRPVRVIPDSTPLAALLRDLRQEQSHLVIASDEYGLVSGLVTLEDVLRKLLGQFGDGGEHDAADVTAIGAGRYLVNAALPIAELNEILGINLPRGGWNTVGGLVFGLAGTIPVAGATVESGEFQFTVETIHRHRIVSVIVTHHPPAQRG